MSNQNILKENERLRFLVEELKRENAMLVRTIEMGTQYTEHFMEKHQAMIVEARRLLQEEHEKHCVSCSAHTATEAVSQQGDVVFSMGPTEDTKWETN